MQAMAVRPSNNTANSRSCLAVEQVVFSRGMGRVCGGKRVWENICMQIEEACTLSLLSRSESELGVGGGGGAGLVILRTAPCVASCIMYSAFR